MSEVKTEELSELAPHILASCKLSLEWLEGHELGESEPALRLRDAINLLEHSGVEFDLTLLEGPDEQELAELREAIAESQAEKARGEWRTTEQVQAELAARKAKRRAIKKPHKAIA